MRRAAIHVVAWAMIGCHGGSKEVERETPIAIHCEAIAPRAIDETVTLRGRVQLPPGGDLPVASQVPGRVARVPVNEGDVLRLGDVVAVLDDANTRDSLRQAEASIDQARAAEANAAATLTRTKALVARGIAPAQELEDTTAKAQEAKANVAAMIAAGDLARRTLGRVAVRATFAGVVTKVWRGPGALVDGTAATPIVQVAASDVIEFAADATSAELANVHEGDAVKGSVGRGGDFEGVVRVRSRALDPATGLGVARITITKSASTSIIGAYGRAVVTSAHRDDVPTLPASALRGAVADGAEVAVCAKNKIEVRAVKIGWRDDERFEVLEGVKPGEKVAVDHVLGLENDTPFEEAK
jgi:HlyD family secretion protein